jgi:hypothetical protein
MDYDSAMEWQVDMNELTQDQNLGRGGRRNGGRRVGQGDEEMFIHPKNSHTQVAGEENRSVHATVVNKRRS